jgi:hypothetical protein
LIERIKAVVVIGKSPMQLQEMPNNTMQFLHCLPDIHGNGTGQLSPRHLIEVEWDTLKNHSVWALGVVFQASLLAVMNRYSHRGWSSLPVNARK